MSDIQKYFHKITHFYVNFPFFRVNISVIIVMHVEKNMYFFNVLYFHFKVSISTNILIAFLIKVTV